MCTRESKLKQVGKLLWKDLGLLHAYNCKKLKQRVVIIITLYNLCCDCKLGNDCVNGCN